MYSDIVNYITMKHVKRYFLLPQGTSQAANAKKPRPHPGARTRLLNLAVNSAISVTLVCSQVSGTVLLPTELLDVIFSVKVVGFGTGTDAAASAIDSGEQGHQSNHSKGDVDTPPVCRTTMWAAETSTPSAKLLLRHHELDGCHCGNRAGPRF